MIKILYEYIRTGKNIAEKQSTSCVVETYRLVLHRIISGYGIDHYLTYSLFTKPVNTRNWKQYLGKREFCQLLSRYNKKNHFWVLEDKVTFADICLHKGLPHPEIAFTCNYKGPTKSFRNFEVGHIHEGFTDLAEGDYIVKTCGGSYGINLWSIGKYDNEINVYNLNQSLSPHDFSQLLEQSGEAYLVQKKIDVAKSLREIMPGRGCGSMRIMTFLRPDGTVSQPYSFLKLTTKKAFSDNFSGNSWGNMLAIINMEKGTIQSVVQKSPNGLYNEISHHPDTGVDLRNYPVPELQDALDLGRRCALSFPAIPAIGWDIVVTDTGALVLEGNPMFDPIGPQLCAGHGVKDVIPKFLEPVNN